MNPRFWKGRSVLVTGHTGFKGSWLSLWMHHLGANVTGFALEPTSEPSLFELADVRHGMRSHFGDIGGLQELRRVVAQERPEIVVHMAAQPLVGVAHEDPIDTFRINTLGTATLLEAVRDAPSVRAVVAITSDKCYENREWVWGYREHDRLGGHDPYSASKACAELVIDSFRRSYFRADTWHDHGVAVASTRAGNVIGGGDWSPARLVPDVLTSLARGERVALRNPDSTRPWQHVLEPLAGYLALAERLVDAGPAYAEAWNFGPGDSNVRSVRWVVETLHRLWQDDGGWSLDAANHPHESTLLKLDSSKAQARLGWRPRLDLETALAWIVEWEKARLDGHGMRQVTLAQIARYQALTSP